MLVGRSMEECNHAGRALARRASSAGPPGRTTAWRAGPVRWRGFGAENATHTNHLCIEGPGPGRWHRNVAENATLLGHLTIGLPLNAVVRMQNGPARWTGSP